MASVQDIDWQGAAVFRRGDWRIPLPPKSTNALRHEAEGRLKFIIF